MMNISLKSQHPSLEILINGIAVIAVDPQKAAARKDTRICEIGVERSHFLRDLCP